MISVGVLAVGTMGGISAFMILNRYAANLRNMSVARALCQERIEQALTLKFAPTNSTVPMAPNADPSSNAGTPTLPILGAISNYSTATGAYTGAGGPANLLREYSRFYTQSDGTTAANANVILQPHDHRVRPGDCFTPRPPPRPPPRSTSSSSR